MKNSQQHKIAFNGTCMDGNRGWARYANCLIAALKSEFSSAEFAILKNAGEQHTWWEQAQVPRILKRDRINIYHAPANGGLPLVSPCPTVLTVHDAFSEDFAETQALAAKVRHL